MTFDVESFVTDLGQGLVSEAPAEIQAMVFASDKLSTEIVSFVDAAKQGLAACARREHGAAEKLELTLRAGKSSIVASAPDHVYSLERLVAKALDEILAKGRELAGA